MTRNKTTLLDELRQEKEMLRHECAESEKLLAQHWDYLKDNAGSLVFQSAVDGVLQKIGFGGKKENENKDTNLLGASAFTSLGGILKNIYAYYPLVWEFAQPILLRYAMRKLKSIFKKKKSKGE